MRPAKPPSSSAASPADSRVVSGRSRIVSLEEGLQALTIAGQPVSGDRLTRVSAGPVTDRRTVEIALTTGETPGWIEAAGGTAVVRVPAGGGIVMLTNYGIGDEEPLPELTVTRLAASPKAEPQASPAPAPPVLPIRELQVEIILHIERQGDRRGPAQGWVGNLGQRLRIEAFGLRPLETIAPGDIEYMGFGPGGRRTPWATDGRMCGTRGRGMPLTGFAIRLKPALQDRYDVIYEGSFFDSGTSPLCRNGEACMAPAIDDPLEAISLRVAERP